MRTLSTTTGELYAATEVVKLFIPPSKPCEEYISIPLLWVGDEYWLEEAHYKNLVNKFRPKVQGCAVTLDGRLVVRSRLPIDV